VVAIPHVVIEGFPAWSYLCHPSARTKLDGEGGMEDACLRRVLGEGGS
jgi:hypothetical protein